MGHKPTGEQPGRDLDVAAFVSGYEAAVYNSEANKQERLERVIVEDIFHASDESVMALYEELSGSILDARYIALEGIARAYVLGPERMGRVWSCLLNDGDEGLAGAAYYAFDALCSDVEDSQNTDLDLSYVYDSHLATDNRV